MNARRPQFDLIVIGSGPAGYKAAVTAARQGAKVALIEKSLPGGTCLNQGCIPKEALIRLARVIQDVNTLNGHGIGGKVTGDFAGALLHKDSVITSIRSGLLPWLRQLGVTLIEGAASFVDAENLRIDTAHGSEVLPVKRCIIATGAGPRQHPLCITDGRLIINSQDFMRNSRTLPASVLCLGGGAIGTEFAYLLSQFGAKVSIVEHASRLLDKPCISERASQTLERKFKAMGISVKTRCSVVEARVENERVFVRLDDGSLDAYACVLVAIGRVPNTQGLALENAGIEVDFSGFIKTNAYLETTRAGIYAAGDVKAGPMTANAAFHDAKVAASNVMSENRSVCNYNRVPIVIDSVLPIASVGLTEDRAEVAGFTPDVARINLAGSTKGRIAHDSEGYIEVVHDEQTGQLLGGTIVGAQAGEMIHLLTVACQSNRGLWLFTDISYSHPSWNEELENAIGGCISSFSDSEQDVFRPGIYASSR